MVSLKEVPDQPAKCTNTPFSHLAPLFSLAPAGQCVAIFLFPLVEKKKHSWKGHTSIKRMAKVPCRPLVSLPLSSKGATALFLVLYASTPVSKFLNSGINLSYIPIVNCRLQKSGKAARSSLIISLRTCCTSTQPLPQRTSESSPFQEIKRRHD